MTCRCIELAYRKTPPAAALARTRATTSRRPRRLRLGLYELMRRCSPSRCCGGVDGKTGAQYLADQTDDERAERVVGPQLAEGRRSGDEHAPYGVGLFVPPGEKE